MYQTMQTQTDFSSTPSRMVLSGRDITKRFGMRRALHEASLDVAAGEIVSVLGPSGSGKSTLLHVLSGIVVADSGDVLIDGRSISGMDESRRTRLRRVTFGFIFQQGHLVDELTAVENVMLPLLLDGIPRREAQYRSLGWLERFGIVELAKSRPGAMSGGQAQRVAAARSLVAKPRVVFADEPTGALDTAAGDRVMEALVEAARDEAVAVLLVTHDPRTAAYAHRSITICDGEVLGDVVAGSC